mmetsp:Transcript_4583/g.19521  ORF Transcript_4583/g.19521 Transcript_4583/m.19521 type:complete len:469 (-) Transcript_4583:82-1488(-)
MAVASEPLPAPSLPSGQRGRTWTRSRLARRRPRERWAARRAAAPAPPRPPAALGPASLGSKSTSVGPGQLLAALATRQSHRRQSHHRQLRATAKALRAQTPRPRQAGTRTTKRSLASWPRPRRTERTSTTRCSAARRRAPRASGATRLRLAPGEEARPGAREGEPLCRQSPRLPRREATRQRSSPVAPACRARGRRRSSRPSPGCAARAPPRPRFPAQTGPFSLPTTLWRTTSRRWTTSPRPPRCPTTTPTTWRTTSSAWTTRAPTDRATTRRRRRGRRVRPAVRVRNRPASLLRAAARPAKTTTCSKWMTKSWTRRWMATAARRRPRSQPGAGATLRQPCRRSTRQRPAAPLRSWTMLRRWTTWGSTPRAWTTGSTTLATGMTWRRTWRPVTPVTSRSETRARWIEASGTRPPPLPEQATSLTRPSWPATRRATTWTLTTWSSTPWRISEPLDSRARACLPPLPSLP